jgi:hypothetical protein
MPGARRAPIAADPTITAIDDAVAFVTQGDHDCALSQLL